jgi:hypothetical protein
MQTDYFVTMEYRKTVRGCQGHICFTLAEETQFLVIKTSQELSDQKLAASCSTS